MNGAFRTAWPIPRPPWPSSSDAFRTKPAGAPMSQFKTLDDADLAGKRVLVRVDLNVPMEAGRVSDLTRIERVLPTIREIAGKRGKVILLAHFGRPKGPEPESSLAP